MRAVLFLTLLLGSLSPAAGAESLIDWVTIPGGTFSMGSDRGMTFGQNEFWDEWPAHKATVTTFQIARTEVTFGQYKACVEAGACAAPSVTGNKCFVSVGHKWEYGRVRKSLLGDDQPVVCIAWKEAKDFSKWVGGRLPTEAEWEYAARSRGKDHAYPGGHSSPDCTKFVMAKGGFGCGRHASWPVCSKPRGNTEQGLCDMAGNVWEWVEDWYHTYKDMEQQGITGLDTKSCCKVRRGGSWHFKGKRLRTTERTGSGPDYRYIKLGFRPARSL